MSKVLIAFLLALMIFAVHAKTVEARQERAIITVVAATSRIIEVRQPPGRAGDEEWVRWGLSDRFGRSIGRGVLECGWHYRFYRYCSGVLRFPRGTLTVAGASKTRSLGTWAVTGGTGFYKGAKGELRFVATSIDRLTITISI